MPNATKGRSEFVEALARGLAVIEAFDAGHPEMTLSEVARRTNTSPAAARRSLHTLAALGYVRCVNKRFLLSARVLTLGSAFLRATHVEEALLPVLRRLVERFGDAASVSVLEGSDILYIAHYSEQRASRVLASVGITYPAYATSMGRVLLAALSPGALEEYLAGIRPRKLTDRTITNIPDLRKVIQQARADGYATAVDEFDYGVTALATSIRNDSGQVVAALNSSGYSGRLDIQDMIRDRLPELRKASDRISETLVRLPALAHSIAPFPDPHAL